MGYRLTYSAGSPRDLWRAVGWILIDIMEIGSSPELLESCPQCGALIDVSECAPLAEIACPSCEHEFKVRSKFNEFTLVDVLGEGGMGSVFRAIDNTLGREVALKILKAEYLESEEDRKQLETEAQITASINHPHVVKVFSFGEDAGQFYLAMEVVEKGSLDDLLTKGQRIPEAQALLVAIQVAQGLEAAYEHGLVHRDLKPGNILFADANTCKLVDFGLAILMKDEADSRGEVWGTPYYIAPERLNAEPEDFRSDMYSLGGTIFHALAGRPPFEAETASMVALKHIKSKNVSLQTFAPHVSSETSYIINRMLDKDPDRRYQSYAELIEHLQYARANLLERAGNPLKKREVVKVEDDKSNRILGIVSMVLVLVALMIGGGLFIFRDAVFGEGSRSDPQSQIVSDANARFSSAKADFFAGRTAKALEEFNAIWENPETPQPLRSWAGFNVGICYYILGQPQDAQKVFRRIGNLPDFTPPADQPQLSAFLKDVPRFVTQADEVNPAEIGLFKNTNYEAMAMIPFALKNWSAGDFDNAYLAAEKFLEGQRPPAYYWVDAYRPVIVKYYQDLGSYRELKRAVEQAKTPADRERIDQEIARAKENSQVGGAMIDKLNELQAQLAAKTSP